MTSTGQGVPEAADQPARETYDFAELYIAGDWQKATGSSITVVSPASEMPVGRVPEAAEEQVAAAVQASAAAREGWAATEPSERAECLDRIRSGLVSRADELARLIASEVGTPLKIASRVQVGLPVTVLESFAELLGDFSFEEQIGTSVVLWEPVGAVACITPWNYPLHQTVAKVAAALAAGCTIVHKPASQAPLSAFVLAEIIDEAGLPPGVFNLVSGSGATVGARLAEHPAIDMVSFTGSTEAGRSVAERAAHTVKRVALELGGKSANVILDDADLARAVKSGVNNCFLNSGQTCSALTRMLVPIALQEDVVVLARHAAEALVVGDPLDEGTRLGPLVSGGQRARVQELIRGALADGATLVTGGPDAPSGLERGYYVQPTVLADVRSEMRIAQEEVFGPVLSILPYEDEDDAVRIANDSIYGLAGAVWSGDPDRALRIARRLKTGQVDINGAAFNPLAPFGGVKQSGNGRELGIHGLREFLEAKSLQL